jgi:hypothetical protein
MALVALESLAGFLTFFVIFVTFASFVLKTRVFGALRASMLGVWWGWLADSKGREAEF